MLSATGDATATPADRRRWRPARSRFVAPAALVGFLLISAMLFRHAWRHPGSLSYGGNDGFLFMWFLRWTPYAIGHGLDPLVSYRLNAPDGVNLMWNTSVPLVGLVLAPSTLLAGPVVTLNILETLAPALSAWVMFLVLRRWTRAVPALVGGLLYGFSPYMIGAAAAHPHLTLAVFPPVVLLLLDDLLARRHNPVRTGVLLGLAVAAQALVSEEVLATTALVAGCGLAIAAVANRDAVAGALSALLPALGCCAVVAGALLAWPLGVQFFGPGRVHGAIQPSDVAVSDLLTFVVPTRLEALSPAIDPVVRSFTGTPSEVSAYLGLPLIALLVLVAVRLWSEPLVRVCAPLLAAVALLSLGPHLHVDGHITAIVLPWRLVAALPVAGSLLPSRLALYLFGLAALLVAIALDRLRGRRRPLVLLAVAAALAPLVPTAGSLVARPVAVPRFFTSDAARMTSPGETALVVPYATPQQNMAMLWQAVGGPRFAMPGCYCVVPDARGRPSFHPQSDALNAAIIGLQTAPGKTPLPVSATEPTPAARQAYARLHPSVVILGPSPDRQRLRLYLSRLTGTQPTPDGGVDLWFPGPVAAP